VFASQLVALGNNFAATESEIARVANEVARATAVFGISAGQTAALGAALKSVGVQAELAGTVMGKAFRTIDAAVRNGGEELENLAEITGKTTQLEPFNYLSRGLEEFKKVVVIQRQSLRSLV